MQNVGKVDQALRVAVGLLLIAMVFFGPQTAYGWLGLILIGTAAFRFCPLYRLFGSQVPSRRYLAVTEC